MTRVNCGCTLTPLQWSVITTIAYVILPERYSAVSLLSWSTLERIYTLLLYSLSLCSTLNWINWHTISFEHRIFKLNTQLKNLDIIEFMPSLAYCWLCINVHHLVDKYTQTLTHKTITSSFSHRRRGLISMYTLLMPMSMSHWGG